MFVEEQFKQCLAQMNGRSSRLRLLPLLTVPSEVPQLYAKPGFSGLCVPREPVNYTVNSQYSCNLQLGSMRRQRIRDIPPGWLKLEEILNSEASTMAKLKERDKRPKRKFEPGDIVRPHPRRTDLVTVGQGIVLRELEKNNPDDIVDTELQLLLVYFAARDVDLYTEARRFARAWVDDPEYKPDGVTMKNSDLQIVKTTTGWLDAPTIEETQMRRFINIMDDIS